MVARNIQTPAEYPPDSPDEFIRAIEELTQAANGGVEGGDAIFSASAQLDDPTSPLNRWVQRLDANGQSEVANALSDAGILAIINGVAAATDKLIYFVDAGTAATSDLTAYARTLLAVANALAGRNILELGTGDAVEFLTAEVGTGGYLVSGTKVVGAQEGAIASLTDSSGGTPAATIVAIGDTSTSNEGSKINDNFASLNAKVDALLSADRSHGLIAP